VIASFYEISRERWEGLHELTLSVLSKEMFKDPKVCKTVIDKFSTPGEMVQIEALSDKRLAGKMSVLHCLMMSHGGELMARYKGLLKSHDDYKHVTNLNDKFTASDAAFVKAKAKGKDQKKRLTQTYVGDTYALIKGYEHSLAKKDAEILCLKASPPEFTQEQLVAALKKISHFMPGDQGRLIEATPLVATTDYPFLNMLVDHSDRPLSALLKLEPDRRARLAAVPTLNVVGVSPPSLKESTVTLASSSVELFLKDDFPFSAAATEQL
nr:hypothetical protein [Tanacetum cinerariifolium]